MDDFEKHLRSARDKFRYILEYPGCFGGPSVFNEVSRSITRILQSQTLSVRESLEVELGFIRVQRMRFNLDHRKITSTLERIASQIEGDRLLEFEHKIIYAEYLLFQIGDAKAAKVEYEQLTESLKHSSDLYLYALAANGLAITLMTLGEASCAEEYFQDSISIFRRLDNLMQYAYGVNNYGVLKKKACAYTESERLTKKALNLFISLGVPEGEALCYNNLGVVNLKTGDWHTAEYCLRKAIELKKTMAAGVSCNTDNSKNHDVLLFTEINIAHIGLLRRNFEEIGDILVNLLAKSKDLMSERNRALILEFLGEFNAETGDLEAATANLIDADSLARTIAPESDVMTEIKRRRAQLYLLQGKLEAGMDEALSCIRLCNKIGDKHELGAVLRILGEIRLRQGKPKKAVSAFEASINILKGINECYEQMRSCLAYSEYLVDTRNDSADIYLLEAKQLCKKLGINFYMSQILLVQSKYEYNNGDFLAARASLKSADELSDTVEKSDQKKLKPKIHQWFKTLEHMIVRVSMVSAEKLKSIGKIYEEARFPIEDLKPELALEVARNVSAESLFLAQRRNAGYRVPLKYNISANDAKHILRRQIKGSVNELFDENNPKIRSMMNGKTLVSVPGQTGMGYILCTIIEENKTFTPRDLEFLFASVEALERAAEEYSIPPKKIDVGDFIEEKDNWLTHPGGNFKEIITLDQEMIKIIRLAERASQTTVPILLEGETGVGKELFARALHTNGLRKKGQFVAINAGGVPLNLLESQLFGHLKGAFTDAVTDRVGLLDDAKGGTLFLDEVGEMSEELQVKLLRLLENGEYRRLGENSVRYADVRVISATNKNLKERVESDMFREDLYYRLATVRFEIPPLRERKRDIEFLVRHFLTDGFASIGLGRRRVNVDMKALEAFEIYPWPGNVRELKNEIMRILSLIGDGDLIRFGMLSEGIKKAFTSKNDGGILARRVERYERRLILKALEQNDWNRSRTADKIGIPRTTLLFKMKQLDIMA